MSPIPRFLVQLSNTSITVPCKVWDHRDPPFKSNVANCISIPLLRPLLPTDSCNLKVVLFLTKFHWSGFLNYNWSTDLQRYHGSMETGFENVNEHVQMTNMSCAHCSMVHDDGLRPPLGCHILPSDTYKPSVCNQR